MLRTARKTVISVAALGALALGGSAIAGAAQSGSSSSGTQAAPAGHRSDGGHVGANGKREAALSGDTAAKVKAAALAKLPGGTVERVETDADHGSPYEAHVRKADGTEVEVLVDNTFQVTAVNTMGPR
jgi:uncharacterized membrane protein YkoI